MSFQKISGLTERFFGDVGNLSIVGGKSDGKQEVRFLICGPFEHLAQKTHRARRMN